MADIVLDCLDYIFYCVVKGLVNDMVYIHRCRG